MEKVKKITYDEMLCILHEKFDCEIFKHRWYDGNFVIYVIGARDEKEIDDIIDTVAPYRTTAGSRFRIVYPADSFKNK